MKRYRKILSNLPSIVIVSLLLAAIVLVAPKVLSDSRVPQSANPDQVTPPSDLVSSVAPVDTGIAPAPQSSQQNDAYPGLDATSTGQQKSTPTPAPGSIEVGPVNEIDLSKSPVTFSKLYWPQVDGNTLIAAASTSKNHSVILRFDLDTDSVQATGAESSAGILWLGFSGSDVAWLEVSNQDNIQSQSINVIDLQKPDEAPRQIGKGEIRRPDLKDGILLWEEYRNDNWGIAGYDLRANKELAFSQDKAFAPYVCSQTWSIYLANRNSQVAQLGSADLHAYNLVTNEDILIGQVPMPVDMTVPHQIACDQDRVAWISVTAEDQTSTAADPQTGQTDTVTTTIGIAAYHIFDIQTKKDQLLSGLGQGFAQIMIRGNILISTNGYVGYDLQRNVTFNALPNPNILNTLQDGFTLALGKDRVIWLSSVLFDQSTHLYEAPFLAAQ